MAARTLSALLFGSVVLAGACGSGSSAPLPSAPAIAQGIRLQPLTAPERAACGRLARSKAVPVLCPTLLPRPLPAAPATPVGVYTFPVCRAEGRRPRCPLYDLAVLYGAPDQSPGHGSRNSPRAFLHFELVGGRGVPEAIGVHGLSGTRPLQRLLGPRTMAGHRGRLYFGLPYDRGGGEYGSHYTFVWRRGPWRYAASLHSWTPRKDTLTVLAAIIAHLSVPSSPAAAAGTTSLRFPIPDGWDKRTASSGDTTELIAANFRLPASAAECEGGRLRLRRGQAVVRVYDYGTGMPIGSAAPVGRLHIGRIRAQRRPPPNRRPSPRRACVSVGT